MRSMVCSTSQSPPTVKSSPFLCPRVDVRLSGPSSPMQNTARLFPSQFPILIFEFSVDEDVLHSLGKCSGIFVGCLVLDCRRIEDRNVREVTFLQQSPIAQAFALRRQRRDLANPLLERKQMLVANIVPQKS